MIQLYGVEMVIRQRQSEIEDNAKGAWMYEQRSSFSFRTAAQLFRKSAQAPSAAKSPANVCCAA